MKLRIKFTKHGAVRYIGHLDTQRYFQRVNRRSGLKVVYSEGFSPHQKMAFAMPLSVGYESDAEYFDVEVQGAESSDAVTDALNREQAEGIKVVDCVLLPEKCENAMASVRAADYRVCFREGYEPPFDIEDAIGRLRDSESYIIRKENKKAKKRKGHKADDGENYKEIDLRALIYGISIDNIAMKKEPNADGEPGVTPKKHADEDDAINHSKNYIISMKVSAGSKDNVKPELVLSSLYKDAGFEMPEHVLAITRCELYTYGVDGSTLIPLSAVGERF